MAHLIPWGTSFNSLPVGTNKVGDTPTFIRQARQGVAERIGQEHNMELSDTATDNHGKHLEGSARCFISNTAVATPDVTIDTVYVEGETPDFKNGRQYYDPEKNRLYVYVTDYAYTDSYGVSHTIDGFVEVTSTVPQLDIGVCTTPQATPVKVAALSNFVLTEGTIFYVKFTYGAVVGATLNVNGTEAKALYISGALVDANSWLAGETLKLRYVASTYVIEERIPTTTGKGVLAEDISGNAATATNALACSGNAATATNALACSGNAATATRSEGLSRTSSGIETITPTSSGVKGQVIVDSLYLFICIETNRWRRVRVLDAW